MTQQTKGLDLFGGQMSVQKISDLSTTPLWPLLSSGLGDSRDELIQRAQRNPDLKTMASAVLEPLDRLRQPAGDNGVREAMGPLLIMYGRPKKTEQELPVWFALYYAALSGFTRYALDEAVSEYIATATMHMIPAPSVLAKLAQPHAVLARQCYLRAKTIAEAPEPRPRKTPEDKAAIAAILEEMRSSGFLKRPNTDGLQPG